MTNPSVICIPLHHEGGKFKTNLELRFTLRSIDENFKGPVRIVIVGRRLPFWIDGVEHLKVEKRGLKHALVVASDSFPDGFFWSYDDCVYLKPITSDDLKVTPANKRWVSHQKTRWAKMLSNIKARLMKEGIPIWDYSRPHGPYFFTKDMVDEGFADWPGMKGKFPWESWILCKRDWPRVFGVVKQYYGKFRNPPGLNARYLNYNDRGNSLELRNWIRSRFPKMSKFETSDEMTKKEIYYLQSRHILNAWESIGSPELRTICECAVGSHSLLVRFKGLAKRSIFIEPDPDMAEGARLNYPWAEIMQVAIYDDLGSANLSRLHGSSYIKGIPWAPAFESCPKKARKAAKVSVATIPFNMVDDGKIDLINLDCEGSEWFVLKNMVSRPLLLQIELYKNNGYFDDIVNWLAENNYSLVSEWGNANSIYHHQP